MMKLRNFFHQVNEEFLDQIFEAKKLVPKQKSVIKPEPKSEERPKNKIKPEQIKKWNSWSPGEQNYVIQRSPEGVYAQAVKDNIIKLKDKASKPIAHEKDEEAKGTTEPIKKDDSIKIPAFDKIEASNIPDDRKSSRLHDVVDAMKPEAAKEFLNSIVKKYGGIVPSWVADVHNHWKNIIEKKPTKEKEKKPEKPEKKPTKEKEVPTSDMKSNVSYISDKIKTNKLLKMHVKGKEIKQIYDDLLQQLINLDKAKPSEKKAKAEKIKNDFGLRIGATGVLNVDLVGELHHDSKKLIGSGLVARNIAKYFEDIGVFLKAEVGEEGKTKTLSTSSKPNLGMTGLDAKDNKYVAEIFSEGPLAALEPGFKKLYMPIDDKGNPIDNKGGKNSLEYLKHSVSNNKALDRTIEASEKLVKAGKLKKEFVAELKAHKTRMLEIVDNEKSIPSADAEKAVGDSYATLACKLSEIDKDAAESVMKNFAEMALYDTEIARGKEVYLPSAGNFPSGDKLKITRKGTKIEKIQSVSIKYGKKGDFSSYGFPGEASKYCLYHKDPKKRELLKSRPGENGYTIGVKDSIIDDRKEFDAILKNSGGIDKAIKDMDKFYKLVKEYKEATAETIAKKGVLAASESAREKLDRIYTKRMRELVDYDKLSDVIGYDNARMVLGMPARKGDPDTLSGPNCFMSAITFSHVLQTSNGLEMLEHNHQEYINGEYHSETNTYEDGTINLKLWKLGWRPYGSRVQGLNAGFNKRRIYLTTPEQRAAARAEKKAAEKEAKKKQRLQKASYKYPWNRNTEILVEKYINNYKYIRGVSNED